MKKETLLQALKIVLPGVDRKDALLEGADTFVFDSEWVKTFNDHISVSYPLKFDLTCAVRAEEFFAVINKMNGPEIQFSLEEEKLFAEDEVTTLKMSVLKEQIGRYIDNLSLADLEWKKLPSDFIDGVRQCMFSAAQDAMYGSLNSIYVGGADIVTSDNFRVSWFKMSTEMDDTLLLPLGAARELLKIGTLTEYSLGEAWVHFRNEAGVLFSSRIILGDFPAERIKGLFSGLEGEKKFSFPEKMLESLDRASILAYQDDGEEKDKVEYVTIFENKGYLICRGERSLGTLEDKIKIPKGTFPEKVKIMVPPRFLKAILPKIREFIFKDDRLIIFNSEKYHHLVSTMEQ
jgi:hypothetical protein